MQRWAVSARHFKQKTADMVVVCELEAEDEQAARARFKTLGFCFHEAIFDVLIVPVVEKKEAVAEKESP